MSDHFKVRIKFQKTGAIRYIGHLDVMRFFQKCTRRADIDVCYSTGFSPHQLLTFAAPLSVGLESLGEYMDVEVNAVTSTADFVKRLNEASVPEIRIVDAKLLPEKAENAMASVAAASYQVSFREGRVPECFQGSDDEIQAALSEFLSQESLPYVKESKKGTREIDLKEGIYALTWDTEGHFLTMLLDASSGDNIKPIQVLDCFLKRLGQSLADNALTITRLDVLTRTDDGVLISMNDVGEEF